MPHQNQDHQKNQDCQKSQGQLRNVLEEWQIGGRIELRTGSRMNHYIFSSKDDRKIETASQQRYTITT